MKQDIVSSICREVGRNFPELAGVRPTVRRQSATRGGGEQYLLVFKGNAPLPGGKKIPRVVRVVADERGHILRMSTSR